MPGSEGPCQVPSTHQTPRLDPGFRPAGLHPHSITLSLSPHPSGLDPDPRPLCPLWSRPRRASDPVDTPDILSLDSRFPSSDRPPPRVPPDPGPGWSETSPDTLFPPLRRRCPPDPRLPDRARIAKGGHGTRKNRGPHSSEGRPDPCRRTRSRRGLGRRRAEGPNRRVSALSGHVRRGGDLIHPTQRGRPGGVGGLWVGREPRLWFILPLPTFSLTDPKREPWRKLG